MSETNCMTCMVGDFKHSLCDDRLCKKYARNGSYGDFEKFLLDKDLVVVLRCRDCKNSYIDEKTIVCGLRGFFVHEDFYCADGEGREDEK